MKLTAISQLTPLAALGLNTLSNRGQGADFTYCANGNSGNCQDIKFTSPAITCYELSLSFGPIDTVISFDTATTYSVFTGSGCTGAESQIYSSGNWGLLDPFRHNVRSILAQKTWKEFACYTDSPTQHTLTGPNTSSPTMDPLTCQAFCANSGNYTYAGLENGTDCYCDTVTHDPGSFTNYFNCNVKCAGRADRTCGGVNLLSLYSRAPPK